MHGCVFAGRESKNFNLNLICFSIKVFSISMSVSVFSFPVALVKTKSDFFARSVETGLGRW